MFCIPFQSYCKMALDQISILAEICHNARKVAELFWSGCKEKVHLVKMRGFMGRQSLKLIHEVKTRWNSFLWHAAAASWWRWAGLCCSWPTWTMTQASDWTFSIIQSLIKTDNFYILHEFLHHYSWNMLRWSQKYSWNDWLLLIVCSWFLY